MSNRRTRRDVLKLGGAAAASVAAASLIEGGSLIEGVHALAAAKWKPLPVGTQAWCVRKQLATDIPGTLAQVSKAGYELLELENAFGKSGADWKAALTAANLKPAGFHHNLSDLRGDKLAATIEFNLALGNRNLIIRSLPPAVYNSADLLKQTADEINGIAEKLKPHQLRVGYHNHTTDFNQIDGEYLVEPLRRRNLERRGAAVRHRQRLRKGRRQRRRPAEAQRRAQQVDAREAVLEGIA